jgi:hypothetical protein
VFPRNANVEIGELKSNYFRDPELIEAAEQANGNCEIGSEERMVLTNALLSISFALVKLRCHAGPAAGHRACRSGRG